MLLESAEHPIPVVQADLQQIYGIIGVIELVSGYHLIVVKRAELVGRINDAEVYRIVETDVLPYKKTVLHLTERQVYGFNFTMLFLLKN